MSKSRNLEIPKEDSPESLQANDLKLLSPETLEF